MLPVRKEIVDLVRYMPIDKLYLLRDYAAVLAKEEEPLTPEDVSAIEKGESQIARGEWVSFDEVKRKLGL
ncbi:MAG TPA: hypothetical protein VN456_03000 [Desulfosporosinus sp.]|nr:hypothetical protein [Desulfosporosinus sp.]